MAFSRYYFLFHKVKTKNLRASHVFLKYPLDGECVCMCKTMKLLLWVYIEILMYFLYFMSLLNSSWDHLKVSPVLLKFKWGFYLNRLWQFFQEIYGNIKMLLLSQSLLKRTEVSKHSVISRLIPNFTTSTVLKKTTCLWARHQLILWWHGSWWSKALVFSSAQAKTL